MARKRYKPQEIVAKLRQRPFAGSDFMAKYHVNIGCTIN
jgi:hypothetical protein